MRLFTTSRYRPIEADDGDVEKSTSPSRAPTQPRLYHFILIALISFALGVVLQYGSMKFTSSEFPHELVWTPDFEPQTTWIKFRGRLMAESSYRGTPSKAIDNAWARFTENQWFDGGAVILGVSKDSMRASRKDTEDEWFNTTVQLDVQNGGGYMATLEVFHQLHCLNMLRQYSYPDYYPPESFKSGSMLREHVDHCIDMLRQVLMCHADTGLVAFHWVEGKSAAYPDFSTWHKCRNPEDVLKWARDHEAPMVQPVVKPDGVAEMPSLS